MSATRWFGLVLLAFSVGCGSDDESSGDDGNTTTTSESCSSTWECVNDVCECEDGTPCDDADDCDVACEVCV